MRDVAVIGAGITAFGERWDTSFRDLCTEAGVAALEDANVAGEQIDAMFVGSMSAGRFIGQEHVGALVADYVGLGGELHVPATRVEAACASGGLAFRQAVAAVASGMSDVVVAAGVEKMTDVSDATDVLAGAADREWESFAGATFPGLYAMIACDYMHKYGLTREQLAQVAVKNHYHGARNPFAQFRSEITQSTVMKSTLVASPLRLFDCSPVSDGAAVVIVCPLERAKEFTDTPIQVLASAQAGDTIALHDRPDFSTMGATVAAGNSAFQQAKLERKDIDFVEVHDCFTIAELCAIEDLGFVPKGTAGKFTEEGETQVGGKLPVNTSGGLKACGHPVGATGIKQVWEVVQQLRGEAGKRQVEGAEIGMTQNVGGTGATVVSHIFRRA
ncbi:thiolase domain-containing protein [Methanocorpusculum vombati]|uniref:Thiolase domain-containing protein n=1 Tax=Methanocorpusculum vombati TaxID=3002864 RepID=A0ABT4IMP6_9EURY|nr:thiolase domain-containing protein [Methanocorpusculum vombati]MCZ9318882.1 thiolase domain-containing protein [Methanocorpusculum sp.]MCZ0863021.1 thiolase domain-containing protein [Methanocorpusculum vombati]MDE2520537.1 thiolase domain-containing protein [Methanocorpusculum sp.]MDE2534593.1 thiolase domain-containing protein [Methanocorpusculum sp.]MDE2546805.1 thiolase domain-containing protein [Methanocorpusculum sp.]